MIFFANDMDHARIILKLMIEFVANSKHYQDYRGIQKRYKNYLENFDKITITEAPTSQFYKVGWADNDTI
jgi:hypothetical protein